MAKDRNILKYKDLVAIEAGDVKPLLRHIYGDNIPLSVYKQGIKQSLVKEVVDKLRNSAPVHEFTHEGIKYTCAGFLGGCTVGQFEDLTKIESYEGYSDHERMLQIAATLYLPEGVPYSVAYADHYDRCNMLQDLPASVVYGAANFFGGVWMALEHSSPTAGTNPSSELTASL